MIRSVTRNKLIVTPSVDHMLLQTKKELAFAYRSHLELRQYIVESDTLPQGHIGLSATSTTRTVR
jgi:hypothetical protein